MQIHNGLGTSAGIQLLHHQIRLHPQQQRLTGVGTAIGRPTLQSFRLEQGLLTDLVLTCFKTALGPNLKGGQSRGLGRRGRNAEGN